MKLKTTATLLIAAAIVTIGVAATMLTGLWHTSGDRVPKQLATVAPATAMGQASETTVAYDPADIRGSYAFGDIATYYAIPLADLAEAFGLGMDEAAAFQVKNLEKQAAGGVEIGTASVRMFVACYDGVVYEPTEEVWLPAAAAQILTRQGRMTDAQAAYVAAHTAP